MRAEVWQERLYASIPVTQPVTQLTTTIYGLNNNAVTLAKLFWSYRLNASLKSQFGHPIERSGTTELSGSPGPILKIRTNSFPATGKWSDVRTGHHPAHWAILPPSRDCEGDENRNQPLVEQVHTTAARRLYVDRWEGAVIRTIPSQDICPESTSPGSVPRERDDRMRRFPACCAFAASLCSITASVLHAQPPAAPPDDDAPGRVVIESLQDVPTLEEVPSLPETTVTARPFPGQPLTDEDVLSESRTTTSLAQSGSSITVINQEQIQARGARTLSEVLRTVPGIDVRAAGGTGQQSSIFTRGSNSSHTKVVLDGVPLNDPASPNRAFNPAHFLLDNVERIEVIRGPQSTLYGSDAIGGVINIVTKRGDGPPSLMTSFEGGSFGMFQQQSRVSGGDERVWYSFSGSWFRNDGISSSSFGTERDGYENGTLSGRIGALITDDFDVDVIWRYVDADADFDGFAGDGPNNLDFENFFLRTQTHLVQFDGNLEHRTGFSFASYKRDDVTGFQPWFDGESLQFDHQSSLKVIEEDEFAYTLIGGVDHRRENIDQALPPAPFDTFPPRAAQTLDEFYVENRINVCDRLFVTAGYRYSDFSRTQTADTYRVTGRYLIDETDSAVHGAIGTGFRTPALAEVASGIGFNAGLVPETSFGWEVGVEQRLFNDRVIVDATYFRNDFENLIDFRFDPMTFSFTAMNVSQAFSGGVEVGARIQVSDDMTLNASYTGMEARDGFGAPLVRRPRHKFDISLGRHFADRRAFASLNWRYVGKRSDIVGFSAQGVNDYSLLDLSCWLEVSNNVRLFGRLDNLTDTNYQDVFGFNGTPLAAFGGVAITWGGGESE